MRWLEYTGLSHEEAAGSGWRGSIRPDDLEKLMLTWRAVLAPEELGKEEARIRRFDGEYRWFCSVPNCSGTRTVKSRDGTERIDIEELKLTEKELQDIVDYVPQLIVIRESDGRSAYANRATLDYLGGTFEESLEPGLIEQWSTRTIGTRWRARARSALTLCSSNSKQG
jgi:PAS domain-containing protein